MLASVDLDDQMLLTANKVGKKRTNGNLTSKFVAIQLPVLQLPPKQTFSVGLVAAQLSGSGCRAGAPLLQTRTVFGAGSGSSSPPWGEVPSRARR